MSKNWDYAIMAENAAKAGGPDAWIKMIKSASYQQGASDMKNKLVLPMLAAGVGIGVVGTIAANSIKKWIEEQRQKKAITTSEAVEAEKFLKKELSDTLAEINQPFNEE